MPAHPLIVALDKMNHYLVHDFLGGPREMRLRWIINLHKIMTPLLVLALMDHYQNFSVACWVYLGLHGGYSYCWLIKDFAFGDQRGEAKVTYAGALVAFFVALAPYWVAPWLLISGSLGAVAESSNAVISGSVFLCLIGLALMIAADCQKYFTLQLKKGLIQEGMFKRIRHPNYLGEILIYSSFALLVRHWLPWIVLLTIWGMVFVPNIFTKEASLSRFPEWPAYKKRTGLLLPKIF